MRSQDQNVSERDFKKELMGILMEKTFYLELPLRNRLSLAKYIFRLYLSKRAAV